MLAAALATAALALAVAGAASVPASAAAASPYRQAVGAAIGVLRGGGPDDAVVAARALAALRAGVHDQPEVVGDLRGRPPRLDDARQRLETLAAALDSPARTGDPAEAGASLRSILDQPRYAGLRPSPLDQLRQWALDRLADVLRLLVGGEPGWPVALRLAAGALSVLVVAGALVLVALALWRTPRRSAARAVPAELRERAGRRFAEADRLAAAGDLAGALRMLTSGVAAALGDERDWDLSPLTVRELLGRAPDGTALRPLLSAFERSAYGGAPPDADAYSRALAAAAPFRDAAA